MSKPTTAKDLYEVSLENAVNGAIELVIIAANQGKFSAKLGHARDVPVDVETALVKHFPGLYFEHEMTTKIVYAMWT